MSVTPPVIPACWRGAQRDQESTADLSYMVIPSQDCRCEIISKQLTEKQEFRFLILSDFFHGIITFEFKHTNRIYTCPYMYVVFSFLWAHFIISHSTYGCPSSKFNMLLFSEWINYCILLAYMYICMNMCEREIGKESLSVSLEVEYVESEHTYLLFLFFVFMSLLNPTYLFFSLHIVLNFSI